MLLRWTTKILLISALQPINVDVGNGSAAEFRQAISKPMDKLPDANSCRLSIEFSSAALYGLPSLISQSVGESKGLKVSRIISGIEEALLLWKAPASSKGCRSQPTGTWLHEDEDAVRRYCNGEISSAPHIYYVYTRKHN